MSEHKKTCWVITGGDIGTENQCLGVAEALGLQPVVKRIKLRFPWLYLSPWIRFGERYSLSAKGDQVAPPWPDILIACGRKSVGIALHVKKTSGGKTFIVQIQNPNISPEHFDLVAVPRHDRMHDAENVLVTTGATHRVTPEKITAAKKTFESVFSPLPVPRVAVLIGGNSGAYRMTPETTQKLAQQLLSLKAGLMITVSRRTGPENTRLLREALKGPHIYFWDGTGENPYFALLGFADHIIVTEDSVSMVSEALSTGRPVHIAPLKGGTPRFDIFHKAMREQGYTKPFTGQIKLWSYTPLNDTMEVADEIRRRMKLKESSHV